MTDVVQQLEGVIDYVRRGRDAPPGSADVARNAIAHIRYLRDELKNHEIEVTCEFCGGTGHDPNLAGMDDDTCLICRGWGHIHTSESAAYTIQYLREGVAELTRQIAELLAERNGGTG